MDAERRGLERVNESEAVGVITPKTDWKSTDFYNLEDHNRIVDNLNELLTRYELDSPIPHGVWGKLLTADHRLAISGAYNRIIQAAGYTGTIDSSDRWFDAEELNRIESVILALNQPDGKAEYSAGLIYDTGAVYEGGAHG